MARPRLPADLMLGNPFAVYKMFGDAGTALYVGRTSNLWNRFRAHARRSPWWSETKRYEIEFFGTYGAAFNAERACILDLQPTYNINQLEPLDDEPEDPRPPPPKVEIPWIKTGAAAVEMCIPASTLRWLAAGGQLEAARVTPGGHYLWDVDDLRRQLQRLRERPRRDHDV